MWPDNLDNNLRKALDIAYKAFPEEFYTLSKLPVVTPSNSNAFIKHMSSVMNQGKHNKIPMFEIMSGSSVFSKLCYSAGIMTLFPVDYRYGWHLSCDDHRSLVDSCVVSFNPRVLLFSPRSAPWYRSKEKVAKILRRKAAELPTLQWICTLA